MSTQSGTRQIYGVGMLIYRVGRVKLYYYLENIRTSVCTIQVHVRDLQVSSTAKKRQGREPRRCGVCPRSDTHWFESRAAAPYISCRPVAQRLTGAEILATRFFLLLR